MVTHVLRVSRVIEETGDTRSFEFEVPAALSEEFRYQPGQFLTVAATLDGHTHLRCYSLSSAPEIDPSPIITVKRARGGRVSNWLNDHVRPGNELAVFRPAGRFLLREPACPVACFAGGSGITPILSLLKSALVSTAAPIRLFYANRDAGSLIFRATLDRLQSEYPGRLAVHYHLDAEQGVVSTRSIEAFLAGFGNLRHYICGPQPYMDLVEAVLRRVNVPADRVFVERFVSPDDPAFQSSVAAIDTTTGPRVLVVDIGGARRTILCEPGETILAAVRRIGCEPPALCEQGACGACLAKVVSGSAKMRHNQLLTDDEIAEGLVLTCQAEPTSGQVEVAY